MTIKLYREAISVLTMHTITHSTGGTPWDNPLRDLGDGSDTRIEGIAKGGQDCPTGCVVLNTHELASIIEYN